MDGGVEELIVVVKIPVVDDDLPAFRFVEAVHLPALLTGKNKAEFHGRVLDGQQFFFYLVLIHDSSLWDFRGRL
jgi:hypothetical protein